MNISFGKKIPIAQCHILDRQQKKFVPATINEYDCTTMSDIREVRKLGNAWRFAPTLAYNMEAKNHCHYTKEPNRNHFFNIEKENGEILGLAFCEEQGQTLDVHFLETKQNGLHKFAGQTLLASLGIYTVNNGKTKLRIKKSLKEAEDFYRKTCGFQPELKSSYLLTDRNIPSFIRQTEKRTHYPIINLQG